MSDTLLVYYSLEGNTEFVAETAAAAADIDVQRLVPDKEPPKSGFGKFFWGGKSVVMHEMPKLMPQEHTADKYSRVIIAFPIWAGSYPPAIASYLAGNDLTGKEIWAIACSAGGNAEKAFAKLGEKLNGSGIKGTLSLTDPAKNKESSSVQITDFVNKIFAEK